MYLLCLFFSLTACADDSKTNTDDDDTSSEQETKAVVTNVSVTGEENNFIFNVTVKSPDLGCNQYADWWEVLSEEGELLYRRILLHSHVDDQPFTRSGGPVAITKEQVVYIRAHMNTNGYGSVVYKGSVSVGFTEHILDTDFAIDVVTEEPLPDGCAF
ncbi:hypothetical protein [Aquimarina addita]